MTLATSVLLRTRGLGLRVYVNDVLLTGGGDVPAVLSLEYGDSYDTPPYAHVELNTVPSWLRAGMDVEIDAGINSDIVRQFTGFVTALPGEEPEFLRDQVIVDGARITSGTPPDDVEVAITATATLVGADIRPALPDGTHIAARIQNHMVWDNTRASLIAQRILTDRGRVPGQPAGAIDSQTIDCAGPLYNLVRQIEMAAIAAGGLTDVAVIGQVLDRVGITDRVIDTPPDGAYTLAADASIDVGTGADQLADLVGIAGTTGLQFHQTPSGITLLRAVDFFPAPTASFTYSTNAAATAYIVSTDGISELAVTYNPTITKGMTGQFTIPHLNVDGRFFVYGVRHVIPRASESDGPTTYLRLRGGNRLGGTVAVNPVAAFTVKVRRQAFGAGVRLIYTLDASDSVSLDGTITAYSWAIDTGDAHSALTTVPAHPLTGKVVTFVVNPDDIVDDLITETLTMTASNGLTDATPIALPHAVTDSAVQIAPVGIAAGIRQMITPDGGVTFNDNTVTAVTCVAGRPADGVNFGHWLTGHNDGHIERTTDNGVSWTTVLAAVGVAFNCIQWDWRNTNVCWALTTDMRLYVSLDQGVTWGVYDALRTTLSLASAIAGRRSIGLPAAGGVYVFGGTGTGLPLIAYDPVVGSHGWQRVTFTGDLATDTATPADVTLRIVDYTAPGTGTECMILEFATAGVATLVAIYSTTSAPGPSRAFTRATGLTAGLKTGRIILGDAPIVGVSFHAMFADRDVWSSTDGIAWTQAANVLPVGFTPNDGVFESDVITGLVGMQGVYLIAAEDATGTGGVYKSTDALASVSVFRGPSSLVAWVAGAKAKFVALGAPGATSNFTPRNLILTSTTTPKKITWFDHISRTWHALVSLPAGLTLSHPRPYAATSSAWFVADRTEFVGTGIGVAIARSADGGLTWGQATIGDEDGTHAGIEEVVKDAAGNVWGARHTTSAGGTLPHTIDIYKSTDGGATWGASLKTITNVRGTPIAMFAHPLNANIVGVIAVQTSGGNHSWCVYTNDGGTTWVTNDFVADFLPGPGTATSLRSFGLGMFANGRLIIGQRDGAGVGDHLKIRVSDDYGATWTLLWTDTHAGGNAAGHSFSGINPLTGKCVAFLGDPNAVTDADKSYPAWSLDYGATWTIGTSASEDAAGASMDGTYGSLYDWVNDALYVFDNTASHQIYKFSPVSADGVWENVTYSQPATMGHHMEAFIP